MFSFFSLNPSSRQTVFWLWMRVAVWCAVITILSSIPNYSGKQANFETLPGILDFAVRKTAHIFEFALLMIYVFRAFEKTLSNDVRWHFLISFGLSILFSVSDEWHQTFVFGRSGTVMDVFVDTVGAFLGYLYCVRNS